MKLNLPRTDVAKAAKGIWARFDGPIRFRIARAGNAEYYAEMQRILADDIPTLRHRHSGMDDRQMEAHLRAASKHVLTGWEGITNTETGEVVEYDHDVAYEILSDPAWKEVEEFVWSVARDIAAFREDEVGEAEGN